MRQLSCLTELGSCAIGLVVARRDDSDSNWLAAARNSEVVEHVFRHEAGNMVATLTRLFGIEYRTIGKMADE